MPESLKFFCSLDAVSMDKDGAGKVRLEYPQSELDAIKRLMALTQKLLKVTVEIEET